VVELTVRNTPLLDKEGLEVVELTIDQLTIFHFQDTVS